jgi:hypothetical protein
MEWCIFEFVGFQSYFFQLHTHKLKKMTTIFLNIFYIKLHLISFQLNKNSIQYTTQLNLNWNQFYLDSILIAYNVI